MGSFLYPDMYIDSILEVPLDYLKSQGIRAFIMDLDNTVTEWNSNYITPEVGQWFITINKLDIKACIISNNSEKRVLPVAGALNIPYVYRAKKPRRTAFLRAMNILQTGPLHTAVIGDQIFTDIWGGNRAGAYTILVTPIANKEFAGTKISRCLETFILRKLTKYSP